MEREERYVVLKKKDVDKLPQELRDQLHFISNKVSHVRCVCIEDDWPEYEFVWDLIKSRVDDIPIKINKAEWVDDGCKITMTIPGELSEARKFLMGLF